MDKDKETKTVDIPYDPEGDSEAKSGTDQFPRVERDNKALKISLWLGIPSTVLIIVLFVLHNWLGYWIIEIHSKWSSTENVCEWMIIKLPLWLTGKGILKSKKLYYHVPTKGLKELCPSTLIYGLHSQKNIYPFLLKYVEDSNIIIRQNAWAVLSSIIELTDNAVVNNEKFLYHIIIAIQDEDEDVRSFAIWTFYGYHHVTNYLITNKYLKEALKSETSVKVKENMDKIISNNFQTNKESLEDILRNIKKAEDPEEKKAIKENVELFVELLREYHKKNKKP